MLFFFIFSVNDREKVIETGEFDCPYCGTTRQYLYKEARPYVSLYFIPLFPVGGGREFVECDFCHNVFEPELAPLEKEKRKGKRKPKTVGELMENAVEPLTEDETAGYR
jgi:uncharacterized Zn-finger protein